MTDSGANETMVKIGDRMLDGSIYAGVSPDTGRVMYSTPQDAAQTHTFGKATKYAAVLGAHGHTDWRIPTASELVEMTLTLPPQF